VIFGKYKDELLNEAKVRRSYVTRLLAASPNIFEELRLLATLYVDVFGRERRHDAVFEKEHALVESQFDFELYLQECISELSFFRGIGAPIGIKSVEEINRTTASHLFSQLYVYKLLNLFVPNEGQAHLLEIIDTAVAALTPLFLTSSDLSSDTQKKVRELAAATVVATMLRGKESPFFVVQARDGIRQILGGAGGPLDRDIDAFIKLHLELMNWAQSRALEKDWLLRYGYYVVSEFAVDPARSVVGIQLPLLPGDHLCTEVFSFRYEAWYPGVESRKRYEERLRSCFETAFRDHLEFWGRYLDLDRWRPGQRKAVTRDLDQKLESVKWLIAWNEGASYEQISDVFGRSGEGVKSGIRRLRAYDLPICRHRRRNQVPNERLEEIKAVE
jgi:hypothetical protein